MTEIPKVIHYIWIGSSPISDMAKQCIASWEKYMSDYEIKLWNEDNFPLTDHHYYKEMYSQGKWAFVSDFMRFWILDTYGGIYFDTDQEIFKDATDLLTHDVLLGQTRDGLVACGFIAAKPGTDFVKKVLDDYNTTNDYSIERTSPAVVTRTYNGLSEEEKKGVKVYSSDVIYPFDAGEKVDRKKEGAYMTHHWSESWVPFSGLRKCARTIAAKCGILNPAKKLWQMCKKIGK